MNTEQPKQPESVDLTEHAGNAATAREVRHTPGPWVLSEHGKIEGRAGTYRQVVGEGGMFGGDIVAHVCVLHPYNRDLQLSGEANASLIAAAPDGHEANKVSLMVLCALEKANDWHPNMAKDIAFAIEANRAAIAKATGATS